MIKGSQKTGIAPFEGFPPSPKRVLPTFRPRQLRAIDIAEGALLADIGVILQLLIKFLPVVGTALSFLIPVVFAVIVLRRGFYVGCMSLCVALFVACIVMGPGGLPFFLLEAGAGLFLGLTMRYRLSHLVICVVGVFGGAAVLWMTLLFYAFIAGGASVVLRVLHQGYASFTNLVGVLLRPVGLGGFWQERLFPVLDTFVQWGFLHWLFFYYLLTCFACIPLVPAVYFIVNFFLRVLGYNVRPFPGYHLEGWLLTMASRLLTLVSGFLAFVGWALPIVKRLLWSASGRRSFRQKSNSQPDPVRLPRLYALRCEVRRLNIGRLRHQRLEREAKRSR